MITIGIANGGMNELESAAWDSSSFFLNMFSLFARILAYKPLRSALIFLDFSSYSYSSYSSLCSTTIIEDEDYFGRFSDSFFYKLLVWSVLFGITVIKLEFKSSECPLSLLLTISELVPVEPVIPTGTSLTPDTLMTVISFLMFFLSTLVILESFLAIISSVAGV